MTGCDLGAKVDAYLDGELSASDAEAVQQHIAGCAGCAAEVAQRVALQRSLRVARAAHAPSAEFRARLRAQVREQVGAQPAAPKNSWALRAGWPVAAAFAAMLLVSFAWFLRPSHQDGLREVADLHLNALASANPLDVVSTDRHTVKPWFQGRIPFSFNVPEFSGTGFTLQGGRVAYLLQQPGAQLFVGVGQHRVSVLLFQESPQMDAALPALGGVASRNAFNVESWHTATLRFVLIGDADPAAMTRLGELLRQANP